MGLFEDYKQFEPDTFDLADWGSEFVDDPTQEVIAKIRGIVEETDLVSNPDDQRMGEFVDSQVQTVRGVLDVLTSPDINEIVKMVGSNAIASEVFTVITMEPDSAEPIFDSALEVEAKLEALQQKYPKPQGKRMPHTPQVQLDLEPQVVFDFESSDLENPNVVSRVGQAASKLSGLKDKLFPGLPYEVIDYPESGGSSEPFRVKTEAEKRIIAQATGVLPFWNKTRLFIGDPSTDYPTTEEAYKLVVESMAAKAQRIEEMEDKK